MEIIYSKFYATLVKEYIENQLTEYNAGRPRR